jgi:hypothetical protein
MSVESSSSKDIGSFTLVPLLYQLLQVLHLCSGKNRDVAQSEFEMLFICLVYYE